MKNIWILTEERPKKEVIITIIKKFAEDRNMENPFIDELRILPILKNNRFTFRYRVSGVFCEGVNEIFLEIITGSSSFVDFLVFYQDERPVDSHQPIYAIEETKTSDKDSRNTRVYQRGTKFVFFNFYYPNVRKIMLYNLRRGQEADPSDTSIFGTRLLMNLDVEILGKQLDPILFKPFETLNEVIQFKSNMRPPPGNNVPIQIERLGNKIYISGRLEKAGYLAHDPNIGALTLISQSLRKLGWTGEIVVTQHELGQNNIRKNNKFIQIANQIGIQLDGLTVPNTELPVTYWKYETESEKLATIFLHLVVEEFTQGRSIFDNHAGCERGDFKKIQEQEVEYIVLEKYEDAEAYKAGNASKRLHLPDLVLFHDQRSEIINIEGKKFGNRKVGIEQLQKYDAIERKHIQQHYSWCKIIRTVVIYGSQQTEITEPKIGFLLNKRGDLVLGQRPPQIFVEAIRDLLNAGS